MDNISKQKFFEAILASDILAPYVERDDSLTDLLKSPDHPDIHYFDAFAIASQLTPIFKQRLQFMTAKNIRHNVDAIQKLVAFTETYPDSQVHNVTFNCPSRAYAVRCGQIGPDLHAICVIIGAHLSDEMLGELVK